MSSSAKCHFATGDVAYIHRGKQWVACKVETVTLATHHAEDLEDWWIVTSYDAQFSVGLRKTHGRPTPASEGVGELVTRSRAERMLQSDLAEEIAETLRDAPGALSWSRLRQIAEDLYIPIPKLPEVTQ